MGADATGGDGVGSRSGHDLVYVELLAVYDSDAGERAEEACGDDGGETSNDVHVHADRAAGWLCRGFGSWRRCAYRIETIPINVLVNLHISEL